MGDLFKQVFTDQIYIYIVSVFAVWSAQAY